MSPQSRPILLNRMCNKPILASPKRCLLNTAYTTHHQSSSFLLDIASMNSIRPLKLSQRDRGSK